MLKIGLNATCFNDRPSGARQRFIGLYGELFRRLPEAEFIVYEPADCRVGSWFDGAPNVSARPTPLPSEGRLQKFIKGFWYWGSALRGEHFDLFEGFNQPVVNPPAGCILLTIHDIRRLHPEWGRFERAAYRVALGRSLEAADHVVTVSQAMKEEILSFYPGIPISVIYNGLDARAFEMCSEQQQLTVRRTFSLPAVFMLAVGHFERRKNYLHLIDAVARLRDRGCPCALVIIGNDSGLRRTVEERVESRKMMGQVKVLSGLTDREVRCIYKLSSLFVFPSTYEGFGIPILEAMAARCPMVLSDLPVFREITQDQGVYFDPHDVESMACAIEGILTSSSERERMITYGNERVRDFSFHALAAQMEDLYKSLT